jgi:hypothetical protein
MSLWRCFDRLEKGFFTKNSFSVQSGLCTKFRCESMDAQMVVLNLYGPYDRRRGFWIVFSHLLS